MKSSSSDMISIFQVRINPNQAPSKNNFSPEWHFKMYLETFSLFFPDLRQLRKEDTIYLALTLYSGQIRQPNHWPDLLSKHWAPEFQHSITHHQFEFKLATKHLFHTSPTHQFEAQRLKLKRRSFDCDCASISHPKY